MSAPRARLFVPSAAWGGRNRRELLLSAAGVAVLFHLLVVAAVVEAPGLGLRPPPPGPQPPPPEAEIVMVKQDTPTVGGTPPPQPTPSQDTRQAARQGGGASDKLEAAQGPVLPPPAPHPADTRGNPDPAKADQATPPPAPAASNLQVNLDLDGQPGWGLVDDHAIHASPDDRYVNKPAAYPRAAAMRGEQGTVYLVTEVAPDGHARSVQIERSSGYPALDRAARNAISAWHFRPAMQGGVAVASEMRQSYQFILDH